MNHNPYLGIPNKFISQVLPQMIEDLFQIVVDPFFPKESQKLSTVVTKRENNFELLYSEDDETKINQRRPIDTPLYPIHKLAPQNPLPTNSMSKPRFRSNSPPVIPNSQSKKIIETFRNIEARYSRTTKFNMRIRKFKSFSKYLIK